MKTLFFLFIAFSASAQSKHPTTTSNDTTHRLLNTGITITNIGAYGIRVGPSTDTLKVHLLVTEPIIACAGDCERVTTIHGYAIRHYGPYGNVEKETYLYDNKKPIGRDIIVWICIYMKDLK